MSKINFLRDSREKSLEKHQKKSDKQKVFAMNNKSYILPYAGLL